MTSISPASAALISRLYAGRGGTGTPHARQLAVPRSRNSRPGGSSTPAISTGRPRRSSRSGLGLDLVLADDRRRRARGGRGHLVASGVLTPAVTEDELDDEPRTYEEKMLHFAERQAPTASPRVRSRAAQVVTIFNQPGYLAQGFGGRLLARLVPGIGAGQDASNNCGL